MVYLLSQIVRLTAIVVVSVIAGLVVAYVNYVLDMDSDMAGVVGLFATLTVPIVVAWLLLQARPFFQSQAANSEDTLELHGTIEPPTDKTEHKEGPAATSPPGSRPASPVD